MVQQEEEAAAIVIDHNNFFYRMIEWKSHRKTRHQKCRTGAVVVMEDMALIDFDHNNIDTNENNCQC